MENLNTATNESIPLIKNTIAKNVLLAHISTDLSKHIKEEYKKAKLTI